MSQTAWTDGLRTRLDELLEEYRATLHDSLEGLTEQEARASLVPSKTTLLGLLKHVTFVEAVWFGEAVSGRPRHELGVASSPDRSFALRKADTIISVQGAHREICQASRQATAELGLHDEVTGTGPRAVWQLYLQMLRELAQHAGHADILREQVLAARQAWVAPG
ncbi:MAG: DinB family protein [Actinomycetota bacterium]|nr:DinB family protein [Actinomycetota bacterium]